MQDIDVDVVVGVGGVGLCEREDHAADNIVGVFSLHLVLQGQDSAQLSAQLSFLLCCSKCNNTNT